MTAVRTVVGACPLDCPDACSWEIDVVDGVATRLRGNAKHPFTAGGLCKKVNPWLDFAADSSRLLTPLRRVGAKGEGQFEPISWDDALATIADRLGGIIDEHGAEAIWPFVGTGNVGWVQGANNSGARLWNVLGTSQHQISICSVSGHVGLGYTTNSSVTVDAEEVVEAGIVVVWGSNTLVANQHFWPFVAEAQSRGAEIVVIDPVATRTAQRADRHLAPIPGTDGALALGLCRAVIDAGGADLDFLAARTLGWEEFEASLVEWTVERTAAVCGVPEEAISALATAIAKAPGPLFVKLGQGMQRQANGGQAARVVSTLPAITGAYGQPGGGLLYSSGGAYGLNSVAVKRPDLRVSQARSLAMTNLGRNLTELDPPVRALVVCGANPMVSNPQVDLVRRGLAREDLFTVAIDIYPTETVDYADIVLPSTMQHEQIELNDSFAHLYLNWNEPAVAPPGECLPHTEIFRRLAAALGLTEPALFASDLELAAAAIDTEEYRNAGIDVERLRSEGFVRVPGATPYRPLDGEFPTPSGRFEFVSERAERDGHGRLPNYRPPAEQVRGHRSQRYALVANGSDFHINSVFAGTERTRSRAEAPPVVIHADDAERDGLADGMAVVIENERGQFAATVRVGPPARRGVASTTKGWWGQGLNATVIERDSDMGRGAVYHDNVVTIRPKQVN